MILKNKFAQCSSDLKTKRRWKPLDVARAQSRRVSKPLESYCVFWLLLKQQDYRDTTSYSTVLRKVNADVLVAEYTVSTYRYLHKAETNEGQTFNFRKNYWQTRKKSKTSAPKPRNPFFPFSVEMPGTAQSSKHFSYSNILLKLTCLALRSCRKAV